MWELKHEDSEAFERPLPFPECPVLLAPRSLFGHGHLERSPQSIRDSLPVVREICAQIQGWRELAHLCGQIQRHDRKRYGQRDSRGRLPGKRPITARPGCVDARTRLGDWEGDTILGADGTRPCVLSLVERKTGYVLIGQLGARTNENTNGLVRQYLPKRTSLAHLTQAACTAIARRLNQRPRRRLGYRTPEECYAP